MAHRQRPNLLEIIWHDLGDWLSCYGREEVPSPNLQALAEDGVVFDHHFCTAPQCSPSRGSIMTGRYPHSNGLMGLAHRGWEYTAGERDLPLLLGDAGYQTFLFGHQHEHGPRTSLAYQHAETQVTRARQVADLACAFLETRARHAEPFFASIGFSDVHRTFGTHYDPGLVERIRVPGYLPDTDVVRKDIATFYENIRVADQATGRILKAAAKSGLDPNTLVFFTTDHGPEFPRAKMTLYDPGIKTALIMKYPERLKSGSRVKHLVSNVDLLPTLLDACGVTIPDNVQGSSFWPLLTEGEYSAREEVFAELTWHTLYDPMRCVRTDRYKYIWNLEPGRPILMGGPPAQRYGAEFIEAYFADPRPEQELYDLDEDPWERHNLGREGGDYNSTRAELKGRLMGFLEDTRDPILEGPVAHPGTSGYECYWVEEAGRFRLRIDTDFHERPV